MLVHYNNGDSKHILTGNGFYGTIRLSSLPQ